jgi:hypothetical protein
MHANITDLFGKISSLLTSTGDRRLDATPAGVPCGPSAVLEKFAHRVLTRKFDQIAFAKSHCWHRFNWFEQPHFIHLRIGPPSCSSHWLHASF